MPFCPNLDCPHRARTGRPAEFEAGRSLCADCKTPLVDENPQPSERLPPISAALKKRLLWTLAPLAFLWLGMLCPMPFLNSQIISDGQREMTPEAVRFGPFSLGITPFLIGFILVEIFALGVPALRRRRLDDPVLRRKLWRASLSVGVALGLLQSLLAAWTLEGLGWNLRELGQPEFVADPGWWFRIRFALAQTAGSSLFVLAAGIISLRGVGNGFAVVVLADVGASLPSHLRAILFHFEMGQLTPLVAVLGAALVLAGAFALWRFFSHQERRPWNLPLVAPTCGLLPLEVAWLLCMLPALLNNFLWLPWLQAFNTRFYPGSTPFLVLEIALCLVFLPLASAMYYWRHRKGFAAQDPREWRRAWVFSGLLLLGMVAYGELAARYLGGPAVLLPTPLVLVGVVAVAFDLAREYRFRRRLTTEPAALGTYQDVSDALRAARGAAAPVLIQGLRYRSLGYFFMPYLPLVVLAPGEAGHPPGEPPAGASFALKA